MDKRYKGVIIPAVTPLNSSHQLDEEAVEKLFGHFYDNHVQPFILGTTGEASSLPLALKQRYVKVSSTMKRAGVDLYAGISSNCLQESIDLAKHCFDHGVDAVAATLPSYYALTEGQMKTYFEQLADQIPGPLVIYNIPATTHMSIPLKIIDELSHHDNIVGTKDSERGDERLEQSLALWANRSDFSHFLGWAARSAKALLNGSDGLIPSTGNLIPGLYSEMYQLAAEGDSEKMNSLQKQSDEFGALYQTDKLLGQSLAALKVLLNEAGLCQRFVMPPLRELSATDQVKLKEGLADLSLKAGF